MYTGTLNGRDAGDVRISSSNFTRNIGPNNGTERTNLRLAIGSNFAVDRSGTLYANGGVFSGSISGTTISGGTISGATISGSTIHAGTLYVDGDPVSYGSLGSFVTGVSGFYCNSGQDQGGRTTSVSVGFHLTRRTIYAFGARSSETTDDMTGDTAMIYHGSGESSTPDPGTQ